MGRVVDVSDVPATVAPRIRLGARIAFWAAVPVALMVAGWLTMPHLIAMPAPAATDRALAAGIADLRAPGRGDWLVVHALYAACRCSERIVDHVLDRPALAGADEVVLVVGARPDWVARAEQAGRRVVTIGPEALRTRFHIESAPLLVIAGPDGEVAYAGGYTRRKQGPVIEDVAIYQGLRAAGRADPPLPVLGCASSQRLRAALSLWPFSPSPSPSPSPSEVTP
jgi:hypothetical protein